MKIGIYAGSIRPGGGLTVLIQVVKAFAEDKANRIIVYVGENDTSDLLQTLFNEFENVEEKRFMPRHSAALRYLASKFYFLYESVSEKLDWVFSFNYFLFSTCSVVVYHINLLSFQPSGQNSLAMSIKRVDARLACRISRINIFESLFLMNTAQQRMSGKVLNPKLLYISVAPEFLEESMSELSSKEKLSIQSNLMLVSSIQAHKDNETCLYCLKLLCEQFPNTPWVLRVAGGQSIAQWSQFEELAEKLGLKDHVEILGPVNKNLLSYQMHRSLCLINSSRIESFCMVAIEAMAASCPVIVVDSTSMPESVEQAAIIVKPGSAKMFADAVITFHNNDELRLDYIKRGRERANKMKYSEFSSMLRRYLTEDK